LGRELNSPKRINMKKEDIKIREVDCQETGGVLQ